MTTGTKQLERRRLRAPQADRSALIDPPFDAVGELLEENVRLRRQRNYDVQGRSLAELSRQARNHLIDQAHRLSASYRDVDPPPGDPDGPILLAGHQPQLFHSGVWWKNFVLGALARRHRAAAINLLIDSDTVKSTALRVPGGSVAEPRAEQIPFDRPEPAIPYEQRRIVDGDLFTDFGPRTARRIAPLVPDPIVKRFWPLALERVQETDNLGACLAQARHRLEGAWGVQTLEIPQSTVCNSSPFCWFVSHLLAQLPRLWKVYNQALSEHRRIHRIRSAAHPVPELAADGQWLEAPLWIWTNEDPRQRRLFAREDGGRIVLSDREAIEIILPLHRHGEASAAVERLTALGRRGVKIRSRALITTLWARLALGDLFLHGIGGAKYDQVTDLLIDRFFGLPAPHYMIVSATLHLPVRRRPVSVGQFRQIQHHLRRLKYHPERFIDSPDAEPAGRCDYLAELLASKTRWIRTAQTPRNARIRCRTIRRINEALQPWVAAQRRRLEESRTRIARTLRAEEVLTWREFAFCLYPEKTFLEFFHRLLPKD